MEEIGMTNSSLVVRNFFQKMFNFRVDGVEEPKPTLKHLFSFAETISKVVIQIGNGKYLLGRLLNRILDASEG